MNKSFARGLDLSNNKLTGIFLKDLNKTSIGKYLKWIKLKGNPIELKDGAIGRKIEQLKSQGVNIIFWSYYYFCVHKLAIDLVGIYIYKMSRSRNSEIYVKGYGKSITKEDLKKWFKPYGKINCIQYKGPYSFIVKKSF